MPIRRILLSAIVLLSTPARAADPVWLNLTSPNFTLFTDTTALKARRLLTDLEGRLSVLRGALGEIPPRQFPIEVFLFSRKEEFLEAAPRPTGPDAPREFDKSAYLWRGPDRIYVAALDKSPNDIAGDVGHALGHVFFERTVRWRPFWLAEAAAEQFRKAGQKPDTRRISEKDAYPVADILEIVPARDYDDEAPPTAFRIQSYRLCRVVLSRHRGALVSYLTALRNPEGGQSRLDVDLKTLQSQFDTEIETIVNLPTSPVDIRSVPLSAEAMAIHRGDLLVAAKKRTDAAAWYKGSNEAARAARAILARFTGNQEDAVRVLARASADLPMAGLVHLHFGSVETKIPEDLVLQSRALERAIELLPRSGQAHAQLARVQTLQGKAEEALARIDRALELEPEFADEFFLIQAEALLALHRYGDANASARIAAALPHSDRSVDYSLKASEMARRIDEVRREVEGRRLQQLREEVQALVARREPPPPPAPPPPPERFGKIEYTLQSNRQISIVEAPLPVYANTLVQRGAVGTVTVRVTIGRDGKVTQAAIVESKLPEMNDATLNAAKKWTFRPVTGAAPASGVEARITFSFSLQ
jgi:TonB family protein